YLNFKYKVISVEKENWEIIKKEFNNKTKVYEYTDEKESVGIDGSLLGLRIVRKRNAGGERDSSRAADPDDKACRRSSG
ncbi:MAG: hypothetical protein J6Q12_06415, partial [Bacteroidales bacterium]|nr:hypothetical protein [Bacteroidales bacterium]